MNVEQFTEYAINDPLLKDLLQEIVEDVSQQTYIEEPQQIALMADTDTLFTVAAHALYRFDQHLAQREGEIKGQQEAITDALIKEQIPEKVAQAVTAALIAHVSTRGPDDSIFSAATRLIMKGH